MKSTTTAKRIILAFSAALFLSAAFCISSFAALGTGEEMINGDPVWMGWTYFESGTVGAKNEGYDQAGGDGGRAYGRYQLDLGYALPQFLKLCVSNDTGGYFECLRPYTAYEANSSALYSSNGLGKAWHQAYQNNPELFSSMQDTYAASYYWSAAKNSLLKAGINVSTFNNAKLNGTLYSLAIRDGSDVGRNKAVISTYKEGITVDEWIDAIYVYEGTYVHNGSDQRGRWLTGQRNACKNGTDGSSGGFFSNVLGAMRTAFDFVKSNISQLVSKFTELVKTKLFRFKNDNWYDVEEAAVPTTRDESAQVLMTIMNEGAGEAYSKNSEQIRAEAEANDWDVDMTMATYINSGNVLQGLDLAWFLSVYALKYPDGEKTLSRFVSDMESTLFEALKQKITIEETTTTKLVAVPVYKYDEVTVETCREHWGIYDWEPIDTDGDGIDDDVDPLYGWIHTMVPKTYYIVEKKNGEPVIDYWVSSEDGVEMPNYQRVSVKVYKHYCSHNSQCSYNTTDYYDISESTEDKMAIPCSGGKQYQIAEGSAGDGYITILPDSVEKTFGTVTAGSITNDDAWELFGIDKDQKYYEMLAEQMKPTSDTDTGAYVYPHEDGITNEEMALLKYQSFNHTYGNALTGAMMTKVSGLTKSQIQDYLYGLPADTSGNRKQLIKVALTLVNMVPYCNNGEESKPKKAGYDERWFDYARCDSVGRPSGLDSSGYIEWAYWTAGTKKNGTEASGFTKTDVQYKLHSMSKISNTLEKIIKEDDIKPGDIGIMQLGVTDASSEAYNSVGIYLGDGEWIVNSPTYNTVIITSNVEFGDIMVYNKIRMEDSDLWTGYDDITMYGTGSASVGANIYNVAKVIVSETDKTTNGIIALSECLKNRAVDSSIAGNTVWDAIQSCKEFKNYDGSASKNSEYDKCTPTSQQTELIRSVIDAKTVLLNNAHVLHFADKDWHAKIDQHSEDERASLAVYKQVGSNVFYIDHRYQGETSDGSIIYFGGASRFVSRGSKAEILAGLYPEGVPSTKAQCEKYLTKIEVTAYDGNGSTYRKALTVNKKFAPEWIQIMSEIAAIKFPIDGDTYVYRYGAKNTSAKSSSLTSHSYGTSIDFNPTYNLQLELTSTGQFTNVCGSIYRPVGGYPRQLTVKWRQQIERYGAGLNRGDPNKYSVTQQVVDIMANHGFTWGGSWSSKTDTMHFSLTGD